LLSLGLPVAVVATGSINFDPITISADTDKNVFQSAAAQYSWTHKYCDLLRRAALTLKTLRC